MYTRLLAFLLAATLFVAACAPAPVEMPSYLALLTPSLPSGRGICTGAVIGPRAVLTARHCVDSAARVVTVYGQEAWVVGVRASTTHDVAILETGEVLWVGEYAQLGNPGVGQVAQLWGFCPWQMAHVARHARYNGLVTLEDEGQEVDFGWWIMPSLPVQNNKACGGDSGGVFVADGRVVGVISAVYSELFWTAIGSDVFSVPTRDVWALLAQEVAASK